MPTIGGLKYTYTELTRMSGLSRHTLSRRYNKSPRPTLQELIAPPTLHEQQGGKPRRTIIVRGREVFLSDWAEKHNADRVSVEYRWKCGIRDPYKLIQGLSGTAHEEPLELPPITADMIEWLETTKFARSGMEDEWQIACELIGIEPKYAEQLKAFWDELCSAEGNHDGER